MKTRAWAWFLFLAILFGCWAEDLVGNDEPNSTEISAISSAGILTDLENGRPVHELIEAMEKSLLKDELPQDVLLIFCRLLRHEADWESASQWYAAWIEKAPEGDIKVAVEKEYIACSRLASGWTIGDQDEYDVGVNSAWRSSRVMPPKDLAPLLDELMLMRPKRWEAHALKGQNLFQLGELAKAEAALQKARELGGKIAELATNRLKASADRRSQIIEITERAQRFIKGKDLKSAYSLLEKRWNEDPDLVEFGIKACQLKVQNKDFEDASKLAGNIKAYLDRKPNHPMAPKAMALDLVAEKSLKADELRDKIVASSKGPGTRVPQGRTSSSKQTPSTGGAKMADKFKAFAK